MLTACSSGSAGRVEVPHAAVSTEGSATPSAPAAVAGGQWWSGASGASVPNGKYAKWRRSPVAIAGTWDNGNAQQVVMKSVCTGDFKSWNKPLDVAIGAIDTYKGESWAKAARGAYDARWRTHLTKLKSCWGKRDPSLLYIRFAHEMNLDAYPWKVRGGQEASFVAALKRYSDLRYKILPKAHVVFCATDITTGTLKLDVRKLWPGKDARGRPVADLLAIDTYNGYYVVRTPSEFTAKLNQTDDRGNPLGMEKWREWAESLGVPFAVSEWSNNGDPKDAGKGGEAPQYVLMMNRWFRAHAGDRGKPEPGRLLYEIHYNLERQFGFWPTKVQPKTAAMYRSLKWGY